MTLMSVAKALLDVAPTRSVSTLKDLTIAHVHGDTQKVLHRDALKCLECARTEPFVIEMRRANTPVETATRKMRHKSSEA